MKHIIVADDDASIQEVIALVLQRAGYQVSTFDNAGPLMANNFIEPDLFLIDRQLLDTDGLEVCRFLKSREQGSATPVIIFSASNKIEEEAREAGASGFLPKPFNKKMLIDMIEQNTV